PAVAVSKENAMKTVGRSLLWFILSGLGLSACSMDREALRPTGKTPGQPLLDKLYGAIRNDTGLDFLLGQGEVPFFSDQSILTI
ncbi:hypothetical protein, partial [Rhizorhabdus wittichii]|uniref:hypothetical protein n=1 Tax=Rhizorhabdus wittichii TaxID=160791 RepID=UPI001D01DE0F